MPSKAHSCFAWQVQQWGQAEARAGICILAWMVSSVFYMLLSGGICDNVRYNNQNTTACGLEKEIANSFSETQSFTDCIKAKAGNDYVFSARVPKPKEIITELLSLDFILNYASKWSTYEIRNTKTKPFPAPGGFSISSPLLISPLLSVLGFSSLLFLLI